MPPLEGALYDQLGGLITAVVRQCYRTLFPHQPFLPPALLMEWTQVAWTTVLEDVLPRYDPQHASQAKLSTYAVPRIQGALRDYLAADTLIRVPRQRLAGLARRQLVEVDRFRQHWRDTTGHEPTDEEITTYTGLTPAQRDTLAQEATRYVFELVPVEAHEVPDPHPTPEEVVMDWQATRQIQQCVEALPAELQTILKLIVWRGMSLREVGTLLALSKDTIRVRHQQALARVQHCFLTRRFVAVDEDHANAATLTAVPQT